MGKPNNSLVRKDMGVRSTQLTTSQPEFQKLSLIMICSKIYKICINVEMCEMCKPDTHSLTAIWTAIRGTAQR